MEKSKENDVPILIISIILYIVLLTYQSRNIGYINGVISQIENLIVILLTVKVGKKGFITSIILSLVSSLFVLIVPIIIKQQYESIPGVVIPLVTILMTYLIYSYENKMIKANQVLSVTIDELNKSNQILVSKDKKLTYLAYYDVLTGLPNKQLLIETIDDKISSSGNSTFTVIVTNIDNIKEFTDTYGLNMADEVISSYAGKLKKVCVDKYFIARLSTDRFIIIVEGVQSQSDIINIINNINDILIEPIILKDISFNTTISYGISIYPDDASSTEKIIQYANATVDYVVSNGGNDISFYTDKQRL